MVVCHYHAELANIFDHFKLEEPKLVGDDTLLAEFTVDKNHHNFIGNFHGERHKSQGWEHAMEVWI